jgi:hypothetical protein
MPTPSVAFGKGSSSKYSGANPYSHYYSEKYGYVFGRPFGFLEDTDPLGRNFQTNMLRNNTIINITPGVPKFQEDSIEKVKETLTGIAKELDALPEGPKKEAKSIELMLKGQQKLIKDGVDMRTSSFAKDIPNFLRTYKQLVTQIGVSIFGTNFAGTGIDTIINSFNPSGTAQGFNLWCEKATSVSESSNNSYNSSMFEQVQGNISQMSREIQNITGTITGRNGEPIHVESNNDIVSKIASTVSQAGTVLTGAQFILPKFWADSSFDRQYDISFKFVSPYGDNFSVFFNVMLPFLFILSLALPRQFGPSGKDFPFLVQVDCPGLFSCPMGAISSITFKKGGDNMWFNSAGLPLVIEGSINVIDLYASLTLPANYAETLVNMSTRSFLYNLGGLTMYDAIDSALSQSLTTRFLETFKIPFYGLDWTIDKVLDVQRYLGLNKN